MTKLRHYLNALVLILIACALCIQDGDAAAVWLVAAGKYFKYDITPSNLTDSSYKYILSTDIEAVNPRWTKLNGTWIRYTTVNGGIKYAEEVIIAQPPAPACDAFVCNDDFGWTFNLTKNTVLVCPMVKITSSQAAAYEGLQAGANTCR